MALDHSPDDLDTCFYLTSLEPQPLDKWSNDSYAIQRIIALFWAERLGYPVGERRERGAFLPTNPDGSHKEDLKNCTVHYRNGLATVHGGTRDLTNGYLDNDRPY